MLDEDEMDGGYRGPPSEWIKGSWSKEFALFPIRHDNKIIWGRFYKRHFENQFGMKSDFEIEITKNILEFPYLKTKMLAYRISVPWPITKYSTDPNDIYRGWLEKNVGKQKENWDWGMDPGKDNHLMIYFQNERAAVEFTLFGQI